jgi:Fe-S cluster assembly ATP-binding protein
MINFKSSDKIATMISLKNITVKSEEGDTILENINLNLKENTLNLILGPNAAGKSTLAHIIMGNTDLNVNGEVFFNKKNISKKKLDERARLGIFLAYQNPVEIPGVKIFDFLFSAYKFIHKGQMNIWDFHEIVISNLKKLSFDEDFLEKDVNVELSGGEKKRFEILQMLLFKPKVVLLDEIDSGLDIDSVKEIFQIVQEYQKVEKALVLVISHSPKILQYLKPDKVILIQNKTAFKEGDVKLAKEILKNGYEA